MKITTHRCDLCGGKTPPKKLCQLIVPLSEEEKALRARTEAPRRQFPPMASYYAHIMGISYGDSSGSMTYDICRDCVDGLLASRFREIRKMLALTEE